MERLLESDWLTTSDVGRRMGVEGGTVRYYGDVLRARAYPFRQGPNGEWLWAPEVAEVARAAHAIARASRARTESEKAGSGGGKKKGGFLPLSFTFEQALDVIEYAGRLALSTRPGTTLPETLARLGDLERAVQRLNEMAGRLEGVAARTDRALERGVEGLERVVREGRNWLQGAVVQLEEQLEGVLERVGERGRGIALVISVQTLALLVLVMGGVGGQDWPARLVAVLAVPGAFFLGRWSREWI